jgi:hypothetical protein
MLARQARTPAGCWSQRPTPDAASCGRFADSGWLPRRLSQEAVLENPTRSPPSRSLNGSISRVPWSRPMWLPNHHRPVDPRCVDWSKAYLAFLRGCRPDCRIGRSASRRTFRLSPSVSSRMCYISPRVARRRPSWPGEGGRAYGYQAGPNLSSLVARLAGDWPTTKNCSGPRISLFHARSALMFSGGPAISVPLFKW